MGSSSINKQGKSLAPGQEWDQVLSELGRVGLNDVYFDYRYLSLYTEPQTGAQSMAFDFSQDGHRFFFCYLRHPLEPFGLSDHFDFETAYGYGGPLSTTDDPDFLDLAWQAFRGHANETGLVAGFLRFHPLLENQAWAVAPELKAEYNCPVVYLSLNKDAEQVWSDYGSDNRNKINKAKRLGLEIGSHQGPDALASFARLYETRMLELRAHEDYQFGQAYFQEVANLGVERYQVYLAKADERTIGGALVLLSSRFVHYHLSACPMAGRKYAPNNALRHAVIMDYLGGGREKLHFGGGRTEQRDDPLLKFKQRFSSEEGSFYVGKYLADPEAYQDLCQRWRHEHPELGERYGSRFLCYRYR